VYSWNQTDSYRTPAIRRTGGRKSQNQGADGAGRDNRLQVPDDLASASQYGCRAYMASRRDQENWQEDRLMSQTLRTLKGHTNSVKAVAVGRSSDLTNPVRPDGTPQGKNRELIGEGARSVFGRPRATGPEAANKKCPDSKPRHTGILQTPVESQAMITTHRNFVCRAATKDHTFASAHFHRFLP